MHSILFTLVTLTTALQVPALQVPALQVPALQVPVLLPAPAPLLAVAPVPAAPALPANALELSLLSRLTAHTGRDAWLPPESWAPQDPADSLWRAARAALDDGDARRAAELYRRLRTERRFQNSEYRPHAFYWEAFARHRVGGEAELRNALGALRALRRSYAQFENRVEADRLESRLYADLAATGDPDAARWLREQTERAAGRQSGAGSQCADQEVRVSVVESLLMMSSEQAMPLLKQVMTQKDECNAVLREKAVFILSQNKSGEAEDILLDAARNDPSPKVREQAVFWLSQVNSEKSLEAIEEIIRTATDEKLLEQAVFAASQHRSPRSAQILRDIAVRGNAPVAARKSAIFWLGQSKAAGTNTFLRELYGTVRDTELKEAVLFALSQNREASNSEFLFEIATNGSEPIALRKSALFWAGQQGALPLDRLGELYRSMPDREMRESIIFTISQRREPEAVQRLIEIARVETDVELKKTIVFWLGQSRDPRAVQYLNELIGG